MLKFYTNPELTREVTAKSPKKFSVPTKGGRATSVLYLADTYAAAATDAALIGADTLLLSTTQEFSPDGGQAIVNGMTIDYTGKTQSTLTGVTGLTTALAIGDVVKPKTTYGSGSN